MRTKKKRDCEKKKKKNEKKKRKNWYNPATESTPTGLTKIYSTPQKGCGGGGTEWGRGCVGLQMWHTGGGFLGGGVGWVGLGVFNV